MAYSRFRLGTLVTLAALAASMTALVACSGEDGATPSSDSEDGGTTPPKGRTDGGGDTPEDDAGTTACPRVAKTGDHARKIVVSHPFKEAGGKAPDFEVLDYGVDGKITRPTPNVTFTMRPAFRRLAFTPDGKIGIVAQDDGSLGVFTFDDAGKVKVLNEGLTGDFSANDIVISKDGSRAFVLDPQTPNHTGGLHEFTIGCDGTLKHLGIVVPGGNAHAMTLMPNNPDRAVLVAKKAFDSADGTYVHLLDVSGKPKLLGSSNAFPDTLAIASSVSVTLDGKFAIVTDNNSFEKGSRLVVVNLETLTPGTPIDTPNPVAVAMSPFGNAGLLLNSDGEDALRVVTYSASGAPPIAIGGEVQYVGGKTEIPTFAHVIDDGTLRGRVLVSEVTTIRQVTFTANGQVQDLGPFTFGDGIPNIVGSMGVQP